VNVPLDSLTKALVTARTNGGESGVVAIYILAVAEADITTSRTVEAAKVSRVWVELTQALKQLRRLCVHGDIIQLMLDLANLVLDLIHCVSADGTLAWGWNCDPTTSRCLQRRLARQRGRPSSHILKVQPASSGTC
jgi:hypothetical protein